MRNPASMCGIVGMKPTYGRVSRTAFVPLSFSLDHIGPMTRTVAENAGALAVIAGYDPEDPASARILYPIDSFDEMLEQSAHQPLVCPISLHPFVAGRPYRLRRLRRVFEHINRHRDRIWLTRPRDICAHIESLPAGVVPGG